MHESVSCKQERKMKSTYIILLFASITLFSYGEKNNDQKIGTNQEEYTDKDVFDSASQFTKSILGERLRIHYTEYKRGNVGVDALFESDGMIGYTTFSNDLYQKGPSPIDLKDCILFAANFKNRESAEKAFDFLKANSAIQASDVESMVGPTPVQVRFLEQIRNTGGFFAQQGNYVFFLPENCENPLVESSCEDYENLFLSFITEKNEEIEIINADCEKDTFLIQKIKASS